MHSDDGREAAGMSSRRNRSRLEERVNGAASSADKAQAHFELGLFHDNNGREAEAIPHYEAALKLGLSGETQAQCLAWLASSLYKTHQPEAALHRALEASEATSDRSLMEFLRGLERRIRTKLALYSSTAARRR
jgi:hypothetical protein